MRINVRLPRPLPALVVTGLLVSAYCGPSARAGPQHWGFGFSYLATVEESGGARRLVVYEPPLFAYNTTWPARWLDRTTVLTDVPLGGLAIGDFWPGAFAKEYLATVRVSGGQLTVQVYEPPETFTTLPWPLKSTSATLPVTGTLLGTAVGDLRGLNKDQLVVAMQNGGSINLVILTPPASPTATVWSIAGVTTVPATAGTYLGVACGDFWGEGRDRVALATSVSGATRLDYFEYNTGSNALALVTTDAATDLPVLQVNGLTAADYEKDGFDVLTLVPAAGNTFQLRVAPAKPGQAYNPGPEYTGKALSGQLMPGNGGASSVVVMTGTFGASATSRVGFAAGRVFGYVNTSLNNRQAILTGADAQIAFVHRSPRKDQRPPYGWPNPGEPVTYEVNLHNTGSTAIPAGSVRLKVWYNAGSRNADTDPLTADSPDYNQLIDVSLPAYNPASPSYVMRSVNLSWPYMLGPAGPGATWQRPDLDDAGGERWVVAVLEYAGDTNLRNNRYEMALHSVTFHPILRNVSSLSDRAPTVLGDPPSKEYLCRKIADAVQSMWERSPTRAGEPVLQRLWFDSYEFGWPDDLPEPQRTQKWQLVQSQYEGWRELDGWWGVNQDWERFDWGHGGAELHETGHLFHPCGDLYQYYVSPVFSRAAKMADGTPVQLRTWMWVPDSFGTGETRITWPAAEIMKRCIVGARNAGIEQWWTLAPDRLYVRVLDRFGAPVPGAEVKFWGYRRGTAIATGTTGADGRWDLTSLLGTPTVDVFGRKHFNNAGDLNGTQVFTVRIGDYQEARVLGTEEHAGHSQYVKMGHSWTDPLGWTWDFRTNYAAGAANPTFDVTAAVQGTAVQLGVSGAPGATYHVYRKWEPAYIRTYLGEFTAAGPAGAIGLNLAEADSHSAGRFRAIYEVTQGSAGAESLPRTVQVTGLGNATGLTARSDGKLLVAANAGIANPFCQVFDGTTPYEELFYHFRFGHTALKVVGSRTVTGRYYAMLSASDMTPDYRFDLINPSAQGDYDVRNDIPNVTARSYSTTSPYTIQCWTTSDAARYLPGDQVNGPAGSARVSAVAGDTLTVQGLIFSAGQVNPTFTGNRLAGRPGSLLGFRELSGPRGFDTFIGDDENEYIAIADAASRRVIVWTATTQYKTFRSIDSTARPAAVAAHPQLGSRFFVLDRRASDARLYLYYYDPAAATLSVEAGYPVILPVRDGTGVTEMGLAATDDPVTHEVRILATDSSTNCVKEFTLTGGAWQQTATYTQAIGVYAGNAALNRPTDVAYVRSGSYLRWYAVDGGNRVVLLGDSTPPPVSGDLNGDGQVDFADFQLWAVCTGGPEVYVPPAGCLPGVFASSDLDEDGDADLFDFAEFQMQFGQ